MREPQEFAATGFELPMDASWTIGMCCYADAALVVGDPRYAGPLFDKLAPWAAQWGTTAIAVGGPVCHYLGGLASILGHYDEADAYFSQSAVSSRNADARFHAAQTDLQWAKMLVQRNGPDDAKRARSLLTQTHTVAVANRYGTIERRAIEALELLDD